MKNIISYGGGTQSTAMILMALNGEFEFMPDFAIYADTGGEPQFINDYVNYFINFVKVKYNFDIFVVRAKQGLLHKLTIEPERIAKSGLSYTSSNPPYFTLNPDGTKGMMMRQCTSDFKIQPIAKFINSKLQRGEPYRKWIGISFDERQRMKISTKRIKLYYPLVDKFIRRADSIKYIIDKGLNKPLRSSCFFCPFHSDRYWQWLKDYHIYEFERACEFEKTVQARQNGYLTSKIFLHSDCKPLSEIVFTDKNQMNLFPELIDECGGECGI